MGLFCTVCQYTAQEILGDDNLTICNTFVYGLFCAVCQYTAQEILGDDNFTIL